MAPRFHTDCQIGKDVLAKFDTYGGFYFIDIPREADISIGVDWPYPDLKDDECIITKDIQGYGVEVGDTL